MDRQLHRWPAVAAALFLTSPVVAGPFGVEMGMPLAELGTPEGEISPGMYHFEKLPKSHPAFEGYIVQATPDQGVCWIKAIGVDIPTNEDGTEFVAAFEEMRSKLQRIYGAHDITRLLDENSIWSEPEDFMAGILNDERLYVAHWSQDYGSDLEPPLIQIGLMAEATNNETGYYTVEYYFENHELCDAEASNYEPVDDVL